MLVTGGSGYIGSVVVSELLKVPDVKTVKVIDNAHSSFTPSDFTGKYKLVKGDIRRDADLKTALKDVDTVFHFAAIVGDAACDNAPKKAHNVNVEAVKKLIHIALKHEIEKIIFASTCTIYGLQPNNQEVYEHTKPNPTSLYGVTKLEAEHLFQKAYEENALGACILRLGTVYGPSQQPQLMRFNIFANLFILNACLIKTIKVYGGDKWRPLLYTRDVARAFRLTAESSLHRVSGEVFNVGGNAENYTICQVAEIVADEVPGTRIVQEPLLPDPRSYKVNFDKIENILGFRPRYTLRNGVRELRDLVKSGTYNGVLPKQLKRH